MRDIKIEHDETVEAKASKSDGSRRLYELSLQKSSEDALTGRGDLAFGPREAKVFSLSALPLDAGDAKLSMIVLCYANERFELDFSIANENHQKQDHLWAVSATGLSRTPLDRDHNLGVTVLPKPPKMRIELPNLARAYFTDEHITLDIVIINDEEEHANVSIDVRLVGQEVDIPVGLRWASEVNEVGDTEYHAREDEAQRQSKTAYSLVAVLGEMSPSETQKRVICFQARPATAQCSLEVIARYHLLSELETPIVKSLAVDMHYMQPFEANFDFRPQVSQEPWPSYFCIPDQTESLRENLDRETPAEGLTQTWSMNAGIASFASHPLIVEAIELQVQSIHDKAICRILSEPNDSVEPITLSPNDIHSRSFDLELRKISLDDRLTTYFDLKLLLTWRRDASSSQNATTVLPAPELVIPFGEPRVLASSPSSRSKPFISLDYVIENPSMHVLSFNVSMDASEEFAFSGPKATAVQLVPLSCQTISYRLLPLARGLWISPQVKVLDVHWNKMLKPIATGDMKADRRGVLIWVDAED